MSDTQTTISKEREQFATEYPVLNLFANSDLNDFAEWRRFINEHAANEEEKISSDMNDWHTKHAICSRICDEIVKAGKEIGLLEEDITGFHKEIALNVNEETAIKARALIGRWINNSNWTKTLAFFKGVIKYCIYTGVSSSKIVQKILGEDKAHEIDIMCTVCLCWSMLIESSVCVEKEKRDNTQYMPETLGSVIFIDRLSRDFNYLESGIAYNPDKCIKSAQQYILCTILNFFIEDINRFDNQNLPHQSNIAYVSTARAAFKRCGGDPSIFVYRCLDNGQNWSLFQFLTSED